MLLYRRLEAVVPASTIHQSDTSVAREHSVSNRPTIIGTVFRIGIFTRSPDFCPDLCNICECFVYRPIAFLKSANFVFSDVLTPWLLEEHGIYSIVTVSKQSLTVDQRELMKAAA